MKESTIKYPSKGEKYTLTKDLDGHKCGDIVKILFTIGGFGYSVLVNDKDKHAIPQNLIVKYINDGSFVLTN